MWLARKTSSVAKNEIPRSNDPNDIEFSFDEHQPQSRERRVSKVEQHAEKKPKILTADVIARIRAVDCADSLMHQSTPDQDGRTGRANMQPQPLQHIVGLKKKVGKTGHHAVKTIEITKSSTEPLGFFIRLGDGLDRKRGIFVSRVSPGSVVEANGFLKVGDEILEVNREEVGGFGVDDVVKMIQIPRHLILTVRESSSSSRRRASSETDLGKTVPREGAKTERRPLSKAKHKQQQSRANYYRREQGDQKVSPPRATNKADSTENDIDSAMNSTIEGLLRALRSQTETSQAEGSKQTNAKPAGAEVSRGNAKVRDKPEQTLSHKALVKKSSVTLMPPTSVNLVYDDHDGVSHGQQRQSSKEDRRDWDWSADEATSPRTEHKSGSTHAPSPTSSPRARRRLPTVPVDIPRDSNNAHLGLPLDRAKRQLPTPPPSPPGVEARRQKVEGRKSGDRRSWSGFEGGEREKAVDLSPTEEKSSISQLLGALMFSKGNAEGGEEKRKADRSKSPPNAQPRRPTRKSESHYSDIVEQQRSGKRPKVIGRTSHPEMFRTIEENNKERTNALHLSPLPRRKSVPSTSPENNPSDLQEAIAGTEDCHSKELGFLVYPDDYSSENTRSSHAVSGMISLHLIKAENMPYADRKLLEKKKKVHCTIEVDSERKAVTSAKRASRSLVWYEVFEIEVQHGRQVSLACFTADKDAEKPIASVSFTLAPFVRCGQSHKVIFKMQPQGCVHIEMEFIEMKTLLMRAPSQRQSGVFGFQLNETLKTENSSVPLVVRKCVEEIDKRGLEVVGLYRISGNARRKRQLRALFDEDSNAVDISEENYPDINVVTGILKDYLRELPQPLIPSKMSEDLLKAVEEKILEENTSVRKRALSKMLQPLPESNRETLIYLANHLLRVISYQETNKMNAHNLSVCLGPVLLCPPSNLSDSRDLLDLKRHVQVVEFLLELWQAVEHKE